MDRNEEKKDRPRTISRSRASVSTSNKKGSPIEQLMSFSKSGSTSETASDGRHSGHENMDMYDQKEMRAQLRIRASGRKPDFRSCEKEKTAESGRWDEDRLSCEPDHDSPCQINSKRENDEEKDKDKDRDKDRERDRDRGTAETTQTHDEDHAVKKLKRTSRTRASDTSRLRQRTLTSTTGNIPSSSSIMSNSSGTTVLQSDMTNFLHITDEPLRKQKYYHGYIKVDYPPKVLEKPGDFFVGIYTQKKGRDRDTPPREVSALFVMNPQLESGRSIMEIKGKRARNFFLKGRPAVKKPTIPELIDYFLQSGESVCANDVKLVRPVPPPDYILPADSIALGDELGHGQFGNVYKATMLSSEKDQIVAAKTFRTEAFKQDALAKEKFLEEGYVQAQLRHENIVKLHAIVTQKPPVMLLLEYCANGSTKEYLRKNAGAVPLETQLRFAKEAAGGVKYLESNGWVHRDLAARNCLLNSKMKVKVADFGLTVKEEEMKRRKQKSLTLPVKWLAPEVFRHQKFTTKSDVWAFGVTLYEFFTDAADPYPGISNAVIRQKIGEGKGFRMTLPPAIPKTGRDFINSCWMEAPELRPTFAMLYDGLAVWSDVEKKCR